MSRRLECDIPDSGTSRRTSHRYDASLFARRKRRPTMIAIEPATRVKAAMLEVESSSGAATVPPPPPGPQLVAGT
jgi:hypothetical protein